MRIRVSVLAAVATFSAAAFAAPPAWPTSRSPSAKQHRALTVTRDGQVLHTWPVSTSRTGRFTPAGNFRAFRMEKDHYSKEFDDAPMPYSIFFTERGHAIHGSYETRSSVARLPAVACGSHRKTQRLLFELVQAEGVLKTKVEVAGDERVAIARADRQLTQSDRHASRGGTGLPPQYAPREEDEQQRAQMQQRRERYAAPRGYYDQQFGYQQRPYQAQQQQYYYDGYAWRPYNGPSSRAQQNPYAEQQRPQLSAAAILLSTALRIRLRRLKDRVTGPGLSPFRLDCAVPSATLTRN